MPGSWAYFLASPFSSVLLAYPFSLLKFFSKLLFLSCVQSKHALSFLSFERKYKCLPNINSILLLTHVGIIICNYPCVSSCVALSSPSTACRCFQFSSAPQVRTESSDRPGKVGWLLVGWSAGSPTLSSQGWLIKRTQIAIDFNLKNDTSPT